MSIEEQEKLKKEYYTEALRYMDNAKSYLQTAGKENDRYKDRKYVRTACGTAWSGVLTALDGYTILREAQPTSKRIRKSIEFYKKFLAKQDKKMLDTLLDAYQILHLYGYYDGLVTASVIKIGFDLGYAIIDRIKPKTVL